MRGRMRGARLALIDESRSFRSHRGPAHQVGIRLHAGSSASHILSARISSSASSTTTSTRGCALERCCRLAIRRSRATSTSPSAPSPAGARSCRAVSHGRGFAPATNRLRPSTVTRRGLLCIRSLLDAMQMLPFAARMVDVLQICCNCHWRSVAMNSESLHLSGPPALLMNLVPSCAQPPRPARAKRRGRAARCCPARELWDPCLWISHRCAAFRVPRGQSAPAAPARSPA